MAWQTDLSFIFPPLSPRDLMQNTLQRHPNLAQNLATKSALTGSSLLAVQPPTLGGIGQLPQTDQQEKAVADLRVAILQKSKSNDGISSPSTLRTPSPEIINFLLALSFLAIRVASTFGVVWPTYSYVSSILLIFTGVYLIFEYAAVSLIVQLTVCLTPQVGVTSSNIYRSLIMVRLPIRMSPWQMLLCSGLAFLVTLGSVSIMFHLGLRQFHKVLQANYYTVANILSMVERNNSGSSVEQTTWSDVDNPRLRRCCQVPRCKPDSRGRPLIALGFCCLLVNILVRIPCLCDLFILYWNENDYLCFTTMILFVIVHIAWLMLWFGFAVKQKWNFRFRYAPVMQQSQTSNPDSAFRESFLPDASIQGPFTFPQLQKLEECNEETADGQIELANRNSTYVCFSPLQIQNAAVPSILPQQMQQLPSAAQQYHLKAASTATQDLVMTNNFDEKIDDPALYRGPTLLSPPAPLKYPTMRRPQVWDNSWKQEVVVNVTDVDVNATPNSRRSPRSVSGQSGVLPPLNEHWEPRSSLPFQTAENQRSDEAVAALSHTESGTSSCDQICSQV